MVLFALFHAFIAYYSSSFSHFAHKNCCSNTKNIKFATAASATFADHQHHAPEMLLQKKLLFVSTHSTFWAIKLRLPHSQSWSSMHKKLLKRTSCQDCQQNYFKVSSSLLLFTSSVCHKRIYDYWNWPKKFAWMTKKGKRRSFSSDWSPRINQAICSTKNHGTCVQNNLDNFCHSCFDIFQLLYWKKDERAERITAHQEFFRSLLFGRQKIRVSKHRERQPKKLPESYMSLFLFCSFQCFCVLHYSKWTKPST